MTWSRTNLLLLLVSGLAAIPRVYLGLTAHTWLDYDGYWHLFIARQDNWDAFLWEYRFNVHPPLVFLLLKTVSFFGHHVLVYRSVSILTGIASVFVVGKIAQKVCSHPLVAPITALAFALSWTPTKMSLVMQAYMLCIFFHTFSTLLLPGVVPTREWPKTY